MGVTRDDPAPGRQRLDPGVNDEVMRHARVRVSYRDVDGNVQTEESGGLRAVCHQHEIDQLNGLFWINRLSRLSADGTFWRSV